MQQIAAKSVKQIVDAIKAWHKEVQDKSRASVKSQTAEEVDGTPEFTEVLSKQKKKEKKKKEKEKE